MQLINLKSENSKSKIALIGLNSIVWIQTVYFLFTVFKWLICVSLWLIMTTVNNGWICIMKA